MPIGNYRLSQPDSWTCEPTGDYNHLTYGGSKKNLILALPVLARHPFTKISTWLVELCSDSINIVQSLRVCAYEVTGTIFYGCTFSFVVVMENSFLPFPFAKAMDVINQVLFLIILASFTNGKLEKADLQKNASQLKVTHYDLGEMTENNLYTLKQVSKCNIAPENLEKSRAKITMYTKQFR